MIVQSFRSVMWLGAVAGAALSCYMVSLRVASERAALESVESRILMAKRDIRALDTELTTRGRLRQLERWNVEVLALSAPTEGQFLGGEVALASLTRPVPKDVMTLPPVMASAPAPKPAEPDAKVVLADFRPAEAERASDARPRVVLASAPAVRREATPAKPERKPTAGADAAKKAAKAVEAAKPAAKKPAAEKPVAEKPAVKAADEKKPAKKAPVKLAAAKPAEDKPAKDKPAVRKSAAAAAKDKKPQ